MVKPEALAQALAEWRVALGDGAVLSEEVATARYGVDTSPLRRRILGALLPPATEQVVALLRIAQRHGTPLYPISTGNNWGYGSANPVVDGCVIVDLSRMNRIRELDPELGIVTVEPGVTQRDLRAHLDAHGLRFLVPVTGAGPDCSLLGNALERGYGITPHMDHFGAVMALQAVLADGEHYRTPLTEMGAALADRAFKWGVGPYLDGLFSQGNFGIVTEVTLALARRPEQVEGFFFAIRDASALGATVLAMREAMQVLGATLGAVNLMNALRVLSMTAPYPWDRVPAGEGMPPSVLGDLCTQHRIPPWLGAGALYGSKEVVKAARGVLRRILAKVSDRVSFFDAALAARLGRLFALLPSRWRSPAQARLERMNALLGILEGAPTEVPLRLAYWKAKVPPGTPPHPARDGCGLLWYGPLVHMKPEPACEYVAMVERICRDHGLDPLITLTTLSDRLFDSTIPLLFDRADDQQVARAHACYRALFEGVRQRGFVPYRMGVHSMNLLIDASLPFWRTVARLRRAVDPKGILSPGRYSTPDPG